MSSRTFDFHRPANRLGEAARSPSPDDIHAYEGLFEWEEPKRQEQQRQCHLEGRHLQGLPSPGVVYPNADDPLLSSAISGMQFHRDGAMSTQVAFAAHRALMVSYQNSFRSPLPPEYEPAPFSLSASVGLASSASTTDAEDGFLGDDDCGSMSLLGGETYPSQESASKLECKVQSQSSSASHSPSLSSLEGHDGGEDTSHDGDRSLEKKPPAKASRNNARPKPKMWKERLADLKAFKKKHGHCKVMQNGQDDNLALWVKRQR